MRLHSAVVMQSDTSCLCEGWACDEEGTAQTGTATSNTICAHRWPPDSGRAFRSVLGGMKALSSLVGHDIIFHSARKVMTGSNPHWSNAFTKAPLFPWSHHPWSASPRRCDEPQSYPIQPNSHTRTQCRMTRAAGSLNAALKLNVEKLLGRIHQKMRQSKIKLRNTGGLYCRAFL